MSTVELIDIGHEPAANSGPRCVAGRELASARAAAARGFLVQLVVCEVQLAERNAVWLREIGRQLAPTMSDACDRLARGTEALREELIVLAYRLVGRWNWLDRGRRLNIVALLSQPPCRSVAELIERGETHVGSEAPWVELAALRPIEQMLAAMVPLAVDLAGFAQSEVEYPELVDAARLFGARSQRACELDLLLTDLVRAEPERSGLVRSVEERAIATFTKVLAECAQIGRDLGGPRHRFVR